MTDAPTATNAQLQGVVAFAVRIWRFPSSSRPTVASEATLTQPPIRLLTRGPAGGEGLASEVGNPESSIWLESEQYPQVIRACFAGGEKGAILGGEKAVLVGKIAG